MEEFSVQKKDGLLEGWAVIVKRRWVGIGIFLFFVVLSLLVSFGQTPVYRATVQILVESENPQVVKVEDVTSSDPRGQDYYQTQYKVLESRSLARDVIRRLALDTNPEFTGEKSWLNGMVSWLRVLFSSSKEDDDLSDHLNPYIKEYLYRLAITPVPKSRLIGINFEGHDRFLVAKIADEHANAYINMTLGFRLTGSKDAAIWLMGQTETLKATLKESEKRLQDFTRANDMLALESMLSSASSDQRGVQYVERGGSSEANFISQRLTELNTQQSVLRSERIAAEMLFKQIRGMSINPETMESIPEISNNLLIQKLKGDYVGLSRQFTDMKEKYGDKHPRMVAIKEELSGLLGKIKMEVAKIARGVELQYEVAMAKEKNLEKSLEELKKNASALNEKLVQYIEFKNDVELNRDLYNKVLKRAKETALTSGLSATNVVIVDPAEVPVNPVRPKKLLNTMVAIFLGICVGVGVIFIVEQVDGSVENPEQSEKIFHLPCLGAIEVVRKVREANDLSLITALVQDNGSVAESVRSLATNVIFSVAKDNDPVLMVSSSIPEEGKSNICAALSVIVAQMGRKVLLIDCDLRKPKQHKIFEVKAALGFSDYVLDDCQVGKVVQDTKEPNLKLITAGTKLRNAMQIVSSQKMIKKIQGGFEDKYDIIIVDAPPVLSVSDAQYIATAARYTLLVIKASTTHRKLVMQTLKRLHTTKSCVIGSVLNQVDINKDKMYYGKYYKYYGYYSDDKQLET